MPSYFTIGKTGIKKVSKSIFNSNELSFNSNVLSLNKSIFFIHLIILMNNSGYLIYFKKHIERKNPMHEDFYETFWDIAFGH